jgi:hypothetical protein
MAEETYICNVCGKRQARNFHIPDLQERLENAPLEDRSYNSVDRVDSVRLNIPPEAVIWVCDHCGPAYRASHPDFFYEQ